ncbi:hypothetical protein VST7929_02804 [Vibrio stylophorae]|uniref:Lipoprotein n=1 Tax=Vibrio stylophorae TaxID=659351 RepID=A0ABM8ZWX2_9VIBR|nr:hypothetical protein [Vibrio stylophorae]CAH0535143.1 hypothetical protein VST7929_02804 [Vibrio stylophorae]
MRSLLWAFLAVVLSGCAMYQAESESGEAHYAAIPNACNGLAPEMMVHLLASGEAQSDQALHYDYFYVNCAVTPTPDDNSTSHAQLLVRNASHWG